MIVDDLKRVQADTFAFYSRAHFYHWNVEGPDFVQYHKFLNKIYEEAWEAVDDIAEQVRQLEAYAGNSDSMLKTAHIKLTDTIPSAISMFKQLHEDNEVVMEGILLAYHTAEADMLIGLSNFLQDRMMAHKKLDWMLKSILK